MARLLMIDNYDSFTFNLVQYFGELGADVAVHRNDAITLDEVAAARPDAIVISPGPCTPNEAGVSVPLIKRFAGQVPILGVCLGHQAIGAAFGGAIVRAGRIMHGKTSPIHHDGSGVFAGLPDPFAATRYHSLVIDPPSLPSCLVRTAWTDEDEIMGVRHTDVFVEGVQFHPESILTLEGKRLLGNFLARVPARAGGGLVTPQAAIARLVEHGDLAEDETRAVFEAVLAGEATDAQVGALLVALRLKGETVDELIGVARVLRRHAVAVPDVPPGAVDTCGTGGDGARTFNISTAAALVVAAAGVPVAKHGNRAVSGSVGSADVLEALGVRLELPVASVAACLRDVGIAFLFAPAFHPVLRAVGPVRRELGVRTLFNLLGPLVNPAGVRHQVIGVGDPRRLEPLAHVLAALGSERAWVVHGPDGLDELGLAGPSTVAELAGGTVRLHVVTPADAGLPEAPLSALQVDGLDASVARVRSVLAGERGPSRDVVCLNAAAALVVAGRARDLRDGAARAAAVIDAGAAAAVLARFAAHTGTQRVAS